MGLFSVAKLFGVTIRESATDGSDFTNPDADYRRLFLGEDGNLHLKDSAGTVTDVGGAAGSVATDAIWDAKGDLAGGTGSNTAARLAVGTNNLALIAASGETTGLKWAHPVLTSSTNQLSGDVTMTNNNTFYDGPSLSLAAGTWLLIASVCCRQNSAAGNFTAKLWDGTTAVAAAAETQGDGDGNYTQLALSAFVSPGSTTTYKVSVANTIAGCTIRATPPFNSPGNMASTLTALRVA